MQGMTVYNHQFQTQLTTGLQGKREPLSGSYILWKSEPNLKAGPNHTVRTQISQETGSKPVLIPKSAFTFLVSEVMKALQMICFRVNQEFQTQL